MVNDVKNALRRSRDTIVQDFVGGAALMVGLVALLYLPGLF